MEYSYDGSSIPSGTLKAQLLELLKSDKSAFDALSKVLKIDGTIQCATVSEVISSYEEHFGQLSLDKWKNIFQRLGYVDIFHQCMAANQTTMMATSTDMGNENCSGSLVASDDCNTPVGSQLLDNQLQDDSFDRPATANGTASLPTAETTQSKQTHGAIPKTRSAAQLRKAEDESPPDVRCDVRVLQAAVSENFSNQVAVSELELNLHATTGETIGNMIKETYHSPREGWPSWSLPPPPEKDLKEENGKKDNAEGNREQASVHRVQPDVQPRASSSPHSCVPEVENGRSQCDNVTVTAPEKEERGLHTDSSQQSETPVRPTTPEAAHGSSSMLSVVTGHRGSLQNNPMAEACLPGKEEENGDQVRNAAEHYDATENNGLVTELQKENESLRLDVVFLVRELREKQSECANLRTNCDHVQQQLEESRGQLQTAREELQIAREELRRHLEEDAVLEAESQQLIRMTQEMCTLKEQECGRLEEVCNTKEQERGRLEEHIRQLDERYDHSNGCMQVLRAESQESSEELQSAVGELQGLQQEREQNLEKERERLRLESERLLEERMAEVSRAIHNAESDTVKRLKQRLAREKSKRKEAEEENRQLRALVRQLRSKEEGSIASSDSGEDDARESSSTASSEEEYS